MRTTLLTPYHRNTKCHCLVKTFHFKILTLLEPKKSNLAFSSTKMCFLICGRLSKVFSKFFRDFSQHTGDHIIHDIIESPKSETECQIFYIRVRRDGLKKSSLFLDCILLCVAGDSEYSVTLVEFSLVAEQMAMRRLLKLSSCGDECLCQDCVKRGLPTCWVHCNANRTASTSWRAVICD